MTGRTLPLLTPGPLGVVEKPEETWGRTPSVIRSPVPVSRIVGGSKTQEARVPRVDPGSLLSSPQKSRKGPATVSMSPTPSAPGLEPVRVRPSLG